MLKALENFDRLEEESKFRNWFFTIITNNYISFYRKRLLRKYLSINEYEGLDKPPEIFPRTEVRDAYDDIYIAISRLKPKEKISLLLFEIGGFSVEEIRMIQNEKSSSAVKSRLSRTREKLRQIIEDLERNRKKGLPPKSGITGDLETETLKIINNIKPEKQGG
jgi:RNA polymerase sigma-70 factor (ECF subfamily)